MSKVSPPGRKILSVSGTVKEVHPNSQLFSKAVIRLRGEEKILVFNIIIIKHE